MGRRTDRDQRVVAREISYASSAASRGGRAMIRVMENATGRLGLIRRAEGYGDEVRQGRDFWQVMVERYGLRLDVIGGSLDNIPQEGPLIVIANHPYGILDGLMLGHILNQQRGDFRILAHRIFRKAEDINRIILPISFEDTKEARALKHRHAQGRAQVPVGGRRHRHLPGRHRVHRRAALRPADGPGLAQFHRADDREIRRHGGTDLFRRP